ncbi:putative transferase, protein kinase NAK family [Helianthus annuus]|nr:putative transferase, protein kinase NAK family [Helianthus annuus]KAJ0756937.1 putative transferase, protein kinase NAK family [Helianthus annuus]KAJ0760671.1 putative transferase, protein kinase NAK family [Helianthus annuus]
MRHTYLLFPVHLDGTLFDTLKTMKAKDEFFSTFEVLQIFRQVESLVAVWFTCSCYVRVLLEGRSALDERPSSCRLSLEWASEHVSAPFQAPELWDCPSHADIDERTDVWSLGCTFYAIMYGVSAFEHAPGESGGSLQLAVKNAQIK